MFAVRRAGKFWSGTWTDMCIDQCLVSLVRMKSVGGLLMVEAEAKVWNFETNEKVHGEYSSANKKTLSLTMLRT